MESSWLLEECSTYVVIHVAEGTYQGTISWFQNPNADACAHYVVSKTDDITAIVRDEDIAWHAGNWEYNCHSIEIEHPFVVANKYIAKFTQISKAAIRSE